jgi:nicotinamide mononucleotide transporter
MMEIIAVVATLISVYLTMKHNIWCWPVGIIAVLAYLYVFNLSHLYGQMLLQMIFLLQSIFGWFYWHKYKKVRPRTLNYETLIGHLAALIVGTVIFSSILATKTDNPQPALDVITTLLSLQGTWYLSRKVRLGWLVFFFADMFYVGMFAHQELYYSALLYSILMLMAGRSYILWKRPLNTD